MKQVAWRCLALTALVCAWTASCGGAIEVTETVNEEETAAAAAPPPANASLPSAAAAAAAADGSGNATAPAPQRITLPSFRPSPRVPSLLRLPGEAPRLSSLQLRQTESKDESSEMGGGGDDEGGGGGGGHSGGGFHPAAPPPLDLDVMRKLVKQLKHRGAAGDAHAHPHRHDDEDDDGHKSLQDYDAVVMAYLKAMKAKHKGGSDGYGGGQGGPALSEPKHKQFGFAPTGGADAGGGGFSGFGGGDYSDFGKGAGEALGGFGDFGKGSGGGFSGFGQGGGGGGGGGSAGFSDFGKGGGRGNGFGGGSGDKTKSYDNAFPGFGGGSGGSGGFGTTGFGGSGGGKGQGGKGGSLLHTSGHPYPYHVGHDDPVGYRIPSPIYHHEASGYTSKDRGPQDDDGQQHHRGPGGGGKPKGLAGLVKKALHMAAAFIPLGLFLAALPPTVLNINSTASAPGPSPPGGRQRSLEAEVAPEAGAWLEDALLARWGPRALEDAACEARLLCELARAGARPHAPALSAALWALAHDASQDKISEALQLREVFKAARTDACDIYSCDDSAPPSPPPPPSPTAPPTLGTVAPEVTSDLPHYISESDA